MTGVVGALVALAVVVALVLVLGVRPHVRRLTRTVAVLRADTTARLARLRAIRAERPPSRSRVIVPPTGAAPSSPIGGRGRHRRAQPRS